MSSNLTVPLCNFVRVVDFVKVVPESLLGGLFCLSYILFSTSFAGDAIDKVGAVTINIVFAKI